MTCIVAVKSGGRVLLGGDSAGVAGYVTRAVARPKVFASGEYVIGYTSSFRMGQLLEFGFSPPVLYPEEDVFRAMVARFIPGLRQALKDGGWSKTENGHETGGSFLVGIRGRVFEVHGDFQVFEPLDGISAVGCGNEFALGSLAASEEAGVGPRESVMRALKAAARFSGGVCEPFHVVETPAVVAVAPEQAA
jgi:ATP-dependent protease HslVU (ClpYQ) peptidase subunit